MAFFLYFGDMSATLCVSCGELGELGVVVEM